METLPRDDVQPHIVADALRRHWLIIVVVMLLLTGAATAFALIRTQEYTASAKVLVRPVPGNALAPDSATSTQQVTVAMETEAGLVNSPGVTALVSKDLGTEIEAGSPAIKATVPPNTEIVQMEFTGTSAGAARDGAQAFADAFLQYRTAQAESTQKQQIDSLEKQAKVADENLKRAAKIAAQKNPPPDAASQVQLYASRLAALQASIGQLQVTDTDAGTVVTPAKLPTSPAGLSPILLVLAAAALGLGGGVVLAIWRERNDDHVRAASETSLIGVPTFGALPAEEDEPRLIADRDPGDALHDAYRRIRTGVLVTTTRPSVVVISAVSGADPSSEVAANLGLSLAAAGYQVTVVDATIQHADMADLLGVSERPGLSDMLVGDLDMDTDLPRTHGLSVLPAGTDPVKAREFYAGTGVQTLVALLRKRSDYVIVSAAPASTSDGNNVALVGDGLLLVVADNQTTHEQVANVVERAQRLEVPVLGAIFTPHARRSSQTHHTGSADDETVLKAEKGEVGDSETADEGMDDKPRRHLEAEDPDAGPTADDACEPAGSGRTVDRR